MKTLAQEVLDLVEAPLDKYKAITNFECMECGAKFKKVLRKSTDEIKCPECGSTDVEVD